MNSKITLYTFLLLLTTLPLTGQAQEGIAGLENFRHGRLENGMSYFIKDLKEPQEKIIMRFYVKAGTFQEDSTQLELAHLLEHIAFKPTLNFPQGIQNEALLQQFNMTNRDIGGNTASNCTRYFFETNRENREAIKTGLAWFKDIAMNLQLTEKHINQEKGAVMQEFIASNRDNTAYNMAEKNLKAKLFPLQKSYDTFLEHIQTFAQEDLKRFYKEWYRPDLMAIIIVGDIENMDKMEKQIKTCFQEITTPKNLPINSHQQEFHHAAQFAIQEWKKKVDPSESNAVEYNWFIRQPELKKNLCTKEGYQDYIAFQLLVQVLQNRYQQDSGPSPLDRIVVKNTYKYGGAPFSLALKFKSPAEESREAFKKIVKIILQLRQDGIGEEELQKLKALYRLYNQDKKAKYWQEELLAYWLKKEVLFPDKHKKMNQWLEQLSLEEMNAYVFRFLASMPQDIGIIAPSGNIALNYTETQIRQWILEAYGQKVPSYEPPEVTRQLFSEAEKDQLKKGSFQKQKPVIPKTQEIELRNGVRIVLKSFRPTPGIATENIKLYGFTKHGAACFAEKDYYSAINATDLIFHDKVGQFTKKQINSFKDNAMILCYPYIDYYESGIQAEVHRKKIEELLQLVNLHFKMPTYDPQAVDNWKKETVQIGKVRKDIIADFNNAIRHLMQDRALPRRNLKGEEAQKSIAKTYVKRSFEIYKQIFGNPQEWTFLLTGNFKTEEIIPLLQKYLGNLNGTKEAKLCPTYRRKYAFCESMRKGIPSQTRPALCVANRPMKNIKYDISYYQQSKKKYRWKETLCLQVLGEVADRMLKRLRYEKGFAVYNFRASGNYNADEFRHRIHFNISCQPEELFPIQQEIQLIVSEIEEGKIKPEYLDYAIKRIKKRYTVSKLTQHNEMHFMLYEQLRYDHPWVPLKKYGEFLNQVNQKDIVKMAKRYFKEKNKVELIMSDEALY